MTTNPYVRVVTLVLLLEALAFYAFASRTETVPPVDPLLLFPSVIGDWVIYRDFPLDQATCRIPQGGRHAQPALCEPDHQGGGRPVHRLLSNAALRPGAALPEELPAGGRLGAGQGGFRFPARRGLGCADHGEPLRGASTGMRRA